MAGDALTILGTGSGPPRFLDADGEAVAIPDLLHTNFAQQTITKAVFRVLCELDSVEHTRYKVNLGRILLY